MSAEREAPSPPDEPIGPRSPRRGRRAVVVLVAVAGIAGVGWAVGRATVSPDEREAAVRPPRPTVLTATVVRQVLADEVPIRVSTAPERQVDIAANPAIEGARPVVTDLPVRVGQPVAEGQRVLSVTGRPVLVLGGDLDAYRDLVPGTVGPDVAQLEAALARLGILGEPADDTYGEATKSALHQLYGRAGSEALVHQPEGPGEAELDEAVAVAQRGVDAAAAAGDRAAWEEAARARAEARTTLESVRSATGPMVPGTEVVFVPGLPLTVAAVRAHRGRALPDGASITLRSASVRFRGSVPEPVRDGIAHGLAAQITADTGGATVAAEVASVAERPTEEGFAITLVPTGAVPDGLLGAEARAVIQVDHSKGAVLAVPISAVVSRADGSAVVLVVQRGGRTRDVEVDVGLDADGLVEVTDRRGRLHEGDRVVVGR